MIASKRELESRSSLSTNDEYLMEELTSRKDDLDADIEFQTANIEEARKSISKQCIIFNFEIIFLESVELDYAL